MDAAERNRKGDREIMALTARELEMRQLQRQREQNAWNKETRIQRMENEIADGSARHGIYAIKQQKEAVDYFRGGGIAGLRAHELAMLDKQNKGMLDIQAEKTRTAGEAARQTGLTNIELEKIRGGYTDDDGVFHPGSQTLLEREKMQNGIDMLDRQLQQQQRIAEMEHGTIGPDGKVTPGSRERVATITGQSAVQQQTEANKGLAAQAEINRQKQQEQIAAQIQRSIIAAGGKADAAKISGHANIIGEALKNGAITGKDPATVMAELSEQYKDDPEMLKSIQGAGGQQQAAPATGSNIEKGTRKTFPNGQTGMWDGTKWVPVS